MNSKRDKMKETHTKTLISKLWKATDTERILKSSEWSNSSLIREPPPRSSVTSSPETLEVGGSGMQAKNCQENSLSGKTAFRNEEELVSSQRNKILGTLLQLGLSHKNR